MLIYSLILIDCNYDTNSTLNTENLLNSKFYSSETWAATGRKSNQ